MHPERSRFDSTTPCAAWWAAHVAGAAVLCAVSGEGFLREVRKCLRVSGDPQWDRLVLMAMVAIVPDVLKPSIIADAERGQVRFDTLRGALWCLHQQARGPVPGRRTLSDLWLPRDVIPPRWEEPLENGRTEKIVYADLKTRTGEPAEWYPW